MPEIRNLQDNRMGVTGSSLLGLPPSLSPRLRKTAAARVRYPVMFSENSRWGGYSEAVMSRHMMVF